MNFIIDAISIFLLFLTNIVFSVATVIYQLIITISESNIFTNEVILEFSSRIYVLLGVFMLFKVSFSLINYIVNPEDFTDKQKGVGKLVPNIMITLVLIVFTPRIFAELMDLQHLITSEHLLEKVILGSQYTSESTTDMGDYLVLNLFNAFYYYDSNSVPGDAKLVVSDDGTGSYRYNTYSAAFDRTSNYTAYKGVWDDKATYHPLLGLAAAVVLVLVLIQFCFDIAIRTVKLGFLELIAPIPIISRIDPKSEKDGMFSKWFKMTYKTYLDLFVRLIALYAAVAFIVVIMQTEVEVPPYAGGLSGFMVKAFLMLGALLFAKQLPKLIEDLFGFKLDGGFTLNPMKRMSTVPLVGNKINAGIALAGGGLAIAGRAANNGIRGGALVGLGRLTGNAGLTSRGQSILHSTGNQVRRRWNYTRQEAGGRFRQGGMFDMGSEYKGTTAHQLYEKDREAIREGRREHEAMHNKWEQGNDIADRLRNQGIIPNNDNIGKAFDGKTRSNYALVYNSTEFINSKMTLDAASNDADEYRDQYSTAASLGAPLNSSNAITVNTTNGPKVYDGRYDAATGKTWDLAALKHDYETQLKVQTGAQANHDTMRKIHVTDAEIEDQIKFRKNNPGSNPAPN